MKHTCGACKKFRLNQGDCRRSSDPNTLADNIDDEFSSTGGGCDEWVQADPLDKYPANILELANEFLDNDLAINYILDVWNSRHVGDRGIGYTFLASVGCLMIVNSAGLHEKLSGASGTGKTSAAKKFVHLLPEDMCISGSLSGKAVFYDENLKPGTVIFTDDTNINEDIVTTIKQATSNFQNITFHRTINSKREHVVKEIPPRISWWLTTVDSFEDEQMGNRFITQDVEKSEQHKIDIFNKQLDLELDGITDTTIDEDVLVCRAIFDILREQTYEIIIPYVHAINWNNKENSRNLPIFLDIIRSLALYRIRNLDCFEGKYLAGVEDFNIAKKIYDGLADTHISNQSNDELKLMRCLSGSGAANRVQLMRATGFSYNHVKTLLHGRNNTGGLLEKVSGLQYEDVTVTHNTSEGKHSAKEHSYSYHSSAFGIGSWLDVVQLNEDLVEDEIIKYKAPVIDCTRLHTIARRLHVDCTHTLHTNTHTIDTNSSHDCTETSEYVAPKNPNISSELYGIPENCAIVNEKEATDAESTCAIVVQSCAIDELDTDFKNQRQPMAVSSDSIEMLNIKVLKDIPSFIGIDGIVYNLNKDNILNIPKINATALIKRKVVIEQDIEKPDDLRGRIQAIRNIIVTLQKDGDMAGLKAIKASSELAGIEDTDRIITELKKTGTVYEVKDGFFKVI